MAPDVGVGAHTARGNLRAGGCTDVPRALGRFPHLRVRGRQLLPSEDRAVVGYCNPLGLTEETVRQEWPRPPRIVELHRPDLRVEGSAVPRGSPPGGTESPLPLEGPLFGPALRDHARSGALTPPVEQQLPVQLQDSAEDRRRVVAWLRQHVSGVARAWRGWHLPSEGGWSALAGRGEGGFSLALTVGV